MELHIVSALEKIFPERKFEAAELSALGALRGERVSFQVAYKGPEGGRGSARVRLSGPAAAWTRLRRVRMMPGSVPSQFGTDEGYLSTEPGLFPDLLEPFQEKVAPVVQGAWINLWADVEVPLDAQAGAQALCFALESPEGERLAETTLTVQVVAAQLPAQAEDRTEWFHTDCLADYYGVAVFSEDWWRIVENFAAEAASHGVTMLLTPIHTPPLDTAIGAERTTVQLIDVTVTEEGYQFGFDKLRRWIDMLDRVGIRSIEMAHLFSQWGATCAPKVMAVKDGVLTRILGWDTPATGPEYAGYLSAMLPALTEQLRAWGVARRTVFHISDEPSLQHREAYRAARDLVRPLLAGFPIIDALSDYDFYLSGLVEHPVPATDHISPFLEGKVPGLWCYYCCGQSHLSTNRFFALPSARTRVLGAMMYKYQIQGFLHWGYNFYNSCHSMYRINPFCVSDGDGTYPSGDPFLVYPGPDGTPLGSIREMVMDEAFNDLRAMHLLESLAGRERVLALIEEDLPRTLTFDDFPLFGDYPASLREKVNQAIARELA